MTFLDITFPTPEENLACDEALLDWCELGSATEVLRFWQPTHHFVVLGYSNKVQSEVNIKACRMKNISILRRCSGGGAVLQGPGCLNFSLILPGDGPLQSITGANQFIMERHRDALAALLGQPVAVQGFTDLTLDGRKISGNAQRRRSRCLLFHGAFLLDYDLALMEEVLHPPSRQPPYRQNRAHRDFLTCLPLSVEHLKTALQKAWQAHEPVTEVPHSAIERLVQDKYANPQWTWKW
jgi:lipoate-protein ligase A